MRDNKSEVRPYEGNEPFVFVSYSHEDKAFAERFITSLHKDGYRVWYDRGIKAGSDYYKEISEHIADSNVFIAILSKAYFQSEFCENELSLAIDQQKRITPILMEDVDMPLSVKLAIGRKHRVSYPDFSEDENEFYNRVYEAEGIEK